MQVMCEILRQITMMVKCVIFNSVPRLRLIPTRSTPTHGLLQLTKMGKLKSSNPKSRLKSNNPQIKQNQQTSFLQRSVLYVRHLMANLITIGLQDIIKIVEMLRGAMRVDQAKSKPDLITIRRAMYKG